MSRTTVAGNHGRTKPEIVQPKHSDTLRCDLASDFAEFSPHRTLSVAVLKVFPLSADVRHRHATTMGWWKDEQIIGMDAASFRTAE